MKLNALISSLLASVVLVAAVPAQAGSAESATAEATSLLGTKLYSAEPSAGALAKYEEAKKTYEAAPNDAQNLIWYGRRTAYLGRFQDAIDIFSEGVQKFPDDIRMLRHRGHRYISTRQLDKALADFTKAAEMMEGQPDQVEPDGLPNAQNIPLTTTQGNIRYHLGLTYYLMHDFENAYRVYAEDLEHADNDDGIVASMHWLYMILQRLDRPQEADKLLERIHADMNIIENFAYHRALLFYKGVVPYDDVLDSELSESANAGLVYAFANWHLYNNNPQKAKAIMQQLMQDPTWAAFGYIAAEADLAALEQQHK